VHKLVRIDQEALSLFHRLEKKPLVSDLCAA
jgi:hypothetical protein